ncbi:MAG: histidine kinase [Pseudomonadota bacterium]|nr:histidine kinase [Pseudomonadota bacterium]
MFRKIANWYREWEDEQISVLQNPLLAAQAPSAYRRALANKLGKLSSIERHQLHEFSLKYRGVRLLAAIGKLLLLFTLAGAAVHLAWPQFGWVKAITLANLLGFAVVWATTMAWFNYRWLVDKKRKVLLRATVSVTTGVVCIAAFGLATGKSVVQILGGLPAVVFTYGFGIGLLIVLLPLVIVGTLRNRQYATLTAQLQHEAERERLARELSESQLLLLRAQIEPHFLFNTLGAVQQLAEQGAPRAAELTANLITFLRASLAEMRSEQVTLRQEFGLAEAYLKVMKARLGERLDFRFELSDELAQLTMPGMLVLTLVENAIKHGIEPALRGGRVSVSAQQQDGAVRIRVEDSGAGIGAHSGEGMGLENVRRRLQLAYGEAAGVTLRDAEQGTIADIIVPAGAVK